VGVELYPDFNVFEVAKPYARGLMAERFSPRRISLRLQKEVREIATMASDFPYQIHDLLEELRDGEFEVKLKNPGVDDLARHVDRGANRLSVALVVVGGLIGSSLIGIFAKSGPQVIGLHLLSFLGFVASGLLGAWLLFGIIRSGRL
jgi:ubiquinone biosynthesis protein